LHSSLKWFSVAKSAKLFKSATKRRGLKKHLSLSVAACDEITQTEFHDIGMVVKANVKVTTKSFDYFVGLTNQG